MLSSAYHTRALLSLSLSLCERGNGGVYLQRTIAPGTANGGVCVRTPVPLSSRTLGFGFSPTYVLTFIECMLIQSIRCQKNRPCVCVCVCVCVWIYVSLSLSLSPSNGGVCAPSPSPSLIPSFPFPFSLYPPLSLYVVLPHISYPTSTCFSHPISICGHRTVKAPYPVRSAKLSTVSTS